MRGLRFQRPETLESFTVRNLEDRLRRPCRQARRNNPPDDLPRRSHRHRQEHIPDLPRLRPQYHHRQTQEVLHPWVRALRNHDPLNQDPVF